MPVVDMIKTSNEGNLLFYDVEAPVGRSGANRRTDVLLVQFLLASGLKNAVFGEGSPIQANGIPDQPTMDGILRFQTAMRKQGRSFAVVDGKFDPVPGTRVKTPGGVQYGMVTLNQAFDSMRPGELAKLASLPDCPSELRPLLQVKFITG